MWERLECEERGSLIRKNQRKIEQTTWEIWGHSYLFRDFKSKIGWMPWFRFGTLNSFAWKKTLGLFIFRNWITIPWTSGWFRAAHKSACLWGDVGRSEGMNLGGNWDRNSILKPLETGWTQMSGISLIQIGTKANRLFPSPPTHTLPRGLKRASWLAWKGLGFKACE